MESDVAHPSVGRGRRRLSEETAKSLPQAEGSAPSEGIAAIAATPPSVVLEGDPAGSTDAADPRARLRDSAMTALAVILSHRPARGPFRIPPEREAAEIIALRQNILRLSKQRPNLRGVQVVRLRFLEARFARDQKRPGLLDLRLPKLDRPLNLLLLTLHREPFRPLEQVAGLPVLPRGDRGAGLGMKLLGLPHLRADVPRELDVVRHGSDRIFYLPDPMGPRVVRALGGLQEAFPGRTESAPVEEIGSALPCVLRESDRRAEVRGLANRVPRQGQMVAYPLGLSRVGALRGADEITEHDVVDR